MNDGGSGFDPWKLINILWAALSWVVVWNGRRIVKDVDDLKGDKADKAAVEATIAEIRNDRDRMHKENRDDNLALREEVGSLRATIFDLFRGRGDR